MSIYAHNTSTESHDCYVKVPFPAAPKKVENTVINEFVQLFKPKRTLVPIMKRYLEEREKIEKIRSSMFVKEKRDGNGISEKLKGRLAADGSQKNRTLYGGFQSSTTSLDAIILEPSGWQLRKVSGQK